MKQDGLAMVEALVASALLGLGLLGATRLTSHALSAALQTRQDMQAQALADDALQCAIAGGDPCPATTERTHQGVRYRVQMWQTPVGTSLQQLEVQVQWSSATRASGPQRSLRWQTRVSTLPDGLGVSSP